MYISVLFVYPTILCVCVELQTRVCKIALCSMCRFVRILRGSCCVHSCVLISLVESVVDMFYADKTFHADKTVCDRSEFDSLSPKRIEGCWHLISLAWYLSLYDICVRNMTITPRATLRGEFVFSQVWPGPSVLQPVLSH